MKIKKKVIIFFALVFLLLSHNVALAWQHSISLGYGGGREVASSYHNKGFFLNGKLYKFNEIDRTLFLTIDGSLGCWRSSTEKNKNLETIALSAAFRAYFTQPKQQRFKPYLLLSIGPTILSHRYFGESEQGSHLSLQSTLGGGSEVSINNHDFDINLRFIHYCNAGVFRPNQGIDILCVLSVGYLF